MKVILLQDVNKIGKKFDIKEVSNGYALNFLLPRKQAKMATCQAIQEIEIQKKEYEKLEKIKQEKLLETVDKIKESEVEILAKANDEGKLFAGVGTKEISKAIFDQFGETIEEDSIRLKNPIKEIGECPVEIETGDKKIKLTVEVKSE